MPFQILVHFIIAFMWMLLNESYSFASFVGGYLAGFIILFFLRRFLPGPFYLRKLGKMLALFFLFIRELISSNIAIIKMVYKPNLDIEPGIFAYPTELTKGWQITLLANLISLTPGTLSVAISDNDQTIFIHAMHIDGIEESISDIKNTFEKAIMEVTK